MQTFLKFTSSLEQGTLLEKVIFALNVIIQAGIVARLILQAVEKMGGCTDENSAAATDSTSN